MAEVTQELTYELLKNMQQRFDKTDFALAELRHEMISLRGTIISVQQDVNNIYGVLARYDQRLDRIESRLDSVNSQKHKQGLNHNHEISRRSAPRPQSRP